jgi:hypothetical protein
MSNPDERDLSSAFDELTAPSSTANYATRTPSLEVRTSSRRWPQALATALVVLVAAGGATTFLALRSARQGGTPSSSAGAPPARSGAAIAYDSTAGVTVMFGGSGAAGKVLTDTWTWDGSAWTAAALGPGALVGSRLVDDPADGGVLLVGAPAPPVISGGVVGSGCSGGGVAVPGSTSSSGSAAGSSPAANSAASTAAPALAPAPSAGVPTPGSTAPTGPAIVCPPIAPAPRVQTWVFNGSGWHRAAPGSVVATPPAGAQLAFDPTTRQVVAVSPAGFSCGPPMEGAVSGIPAIACPVPGNSSAASAPSMAPCTVPLGCLSPGTISTWTWSGGSWKKGAANQAPPSAGVALVFEDPATQHATLMTLASGGYDGTAYPQVCAPKCPKVPTPLVTPVITTSTWTASGWRQVSQQPTHQDSPSLAGATTAAIDGHVVVLTATGDTWTFAAGQWTHDTPSRHPNSRSGAAMAEGPGGTTVLFGGAASPGLFVVAAGQSLGSDTWLWNGTAWRQLAGSAPSAPPVPSTLPCGAQGKTVIPPCVEPLPAQVPPAGPVTPQATTP